ncbi:hypothetical protein DAPPUDRAFT_303724 [Daphnia pulex]|uniref:Uncharacterized protein n=1 Tax=Daphnia pulex TaxID=6669 RepID=E9GHL3_DAPPU|nr:hypothetical protein DAPPUDRAFT_303724 [Daphnia pulex]|eukprot:EFX80862.1 hypothetical protein DAPPUDRAFT_303724 [Daphnia pulex]
MGSADGILLVSLGLKNSIHHESVHFWRPHFRRCCWIHSGVRRQTSGHREPIDVRNVDGSSQWSFAGSDGTTREESQIQKQLSSGYDKETALGNTNKGSTYYISPEGQKITLTWISDENGFQPKGDHLPTPPPVPEEIARMLPTLPKLVEPYQSV